MNFKKYHVSKNLFDYSTTEIGSISTTDGSDVEYDYARRSDFIPVQAGVTYTFSGLGGNIRIFEYKPDKTYRNTNYLYTIPVEISRTGYIRIAGALTAVIPEIMLNEGSQPLPYEPYSSEVWHDIPHYIHNTSTDTITTLPADIYANDTTATVGLKGNMVQTGTPTPQNPITPSETGERTGNLLATSTENYAIDASGNFNSNWEFMYYTAPCEANEAYTFSLDRGLSGNNVRIHAFNGDTWIEQLVGKPITDAPFTVTTPASTTNLKISITKAAKTYHTMLNTGSTALPYEPYGIKIPILCGNQTTNIYLGEVQTTRNIGKIDLGTLNWSRTTSGNFWANTAITNIKVVPNGTKNNAFCDAFKEVIAEAVASTPYSFCSCMNNQGRPFINSTGFENMTTTEFKEAMSGVYMYYVLATPETGIVNEPLMKIGDYADEVSGISIPTIAGANTLSVDTTLKPSEVTVNYHGWHPVTDVHEADNGAWT